MTNTPATNCPACGRALVRISVRRPTGELTMCSCSRCDLRWWQVDGRLVSLETVLAELTAEPVR